MRLATHLAINLLSYSRPIQTLSILYPAAIAEIELKQTHTANFYTINNSSGKKIDLSFYNTVSFTLKKEGLPGEYIHFGKENRSHPC